MKDSSKEGERPKVSFRFRPKTSKLLDELAEKTESRRGEVVEDAVRFYAMVYDELSKGRIIITTDEEGKDPYRLVIS